MICLQRIMSGGSRVGTPAENVRKSTGRVGGDTLGREGKHRCRVTRTAALSVMSGSSYGIQSVCWFSRRLFKNQTVLEGMEEVTSSYCYP